MRSGSSSRATRCNVLYAIAADLLLALHVLFVVFVVVGLLVILAGAALGWSWIRNPWFRLAHVVSIIVVALQAWLGRICPLTVWEMALRARAGEATYSGDFIGHWLQRLLYFEAPLWVFAVCYTAFAALVAACWVWIRPYALQGRDSP